MVRGKMAIFLSLQTLLSPKHLGVCPRPDPVFRFQVLRRPACNLLISCALLHNNRGRKKIFDMFFTRARFFPSFPVAFSA